MRCTTHFLLVETPRIQDSRISVVVLLEFNKGFISTGTSLIHLSKSVKSIDSLVSFIGMSSSNSITLITAHNKSKLASENLTKRCNAQKQDFH